MTDIILALIGGVTFGLMAITPWHIYKAGYNKGWRDCDTHIVKQIKPLQDKLREATRTDRTY